MQSIIVIIITAARCPSPAKYSKYAEKMNSERARRTRTSGKTARVAVDGVVPKRSWLPPSPPWTRAPEAARGADLKTKHYACNVTVPK